MNLLLLSDDDALVKLVRAAIRPPWQIDHHDNTNGDLFRLPHVKLVLVDDGMIKESERSWLLGQIRQRAAGPRLCMWPTLTIWKMNDGREPAGRSTTPRNQWTSNSSSRSCNHS